MSEDARGPRRARYLFVANPDSDHSDDAQPVHYQAPLQPVRTHYPAPLTTTHNPAPPSPSTTTSSPGPDESTPPPATPAADHDPQVPVSRTGKFIQSLRAPFYSRQTTPDPVPGRTLIVVTTDSDWYVTVDITGASSAAVVRECIFNKLNIQDDDQLRFAIYQTEMGAYAIGDALSDDRLFTLCRKNGDSKGSLKFFVSHSSAPVHEQPLRPHSPPATTIPPPVLPFSANPAPLRPKRRSRQESLSSASEQYPQETAAGYEADLDNPERDTFKPPHPLPSPPQQPHLPVAAVSPPSPRHPRRPNGHLPRPASPLPRPPKTISPPPDIDHRQLSAALPPPPLSPNRTTFHLDEGSLMPPGLRVHGRTGSDAAEERERVLKASEQQYEGGGRQLRHKQHAFGARLRNEPSRESLSPQKDKQKRYQNEIADPVRSDSWVVVPSLSNRPNDQELSPPIQESRSTFSRSGPRQPQPSSYNKITSPYTGRSLAIPNAPRQPPPIPIAPNEGRSSAPRPAGVPIPPKYFAWRGEQRGEPRGTTSNWNRLATKGTKSMDNLRAIAYTSQPGVARRVVAQLPMTRQTPPVPPYPSYPTGLPKSHELQRSTVRPLPVQGSVHSSNLDLGRDTHLGSRGGTPYYNNLMSPSQEPYPRPQSAFGDSMTSPTRKHQHLQSPTYGGSESGEPGPRGLSPNRPYHSTHHASYKLDNNYTSRSDRSSDVQSGPETSYTTPPRTPSSPRNPLREKNVSSSRPSTSDSTKLHGAHENYRGSESTLRPEDQTWFSTVINQNSDGTLIAPHAQENGRMAKPESPPSPSDMTESTYLIHLEQEYDSGGDDLGTSIWKKRPTTADAEKPKTGQRPPLKVHIDASSSDKLETSSSTATQTSQHLSLTATPTPPPRRPITPAQPFEPQKRAPSQGEKGSRMSTFTERQSSTWATRPPPEDVYERLEEFFPEHDLDKPVIEANSGGTSPTIVESAAPVSPVLPPLEKSRMRGKKSIRIVAEEHKKLIDRRSRDAASYSNNVLRKRSTKLWGSKLEEVTTAQAIFQGAPDSPPSTGGTKPTFKWVRGELIGRGTYGRVYLALNATTGEMIAVKQVEIPQTASDKNDSRQVTVVQALKMESETLKDLDHPHIVQYLGFEETPENLSIFLEYVPGGSIGSCLLKHGKFDEDVTKSFTGQILAGLEYLHSKGILHRDLKADNILVEMSGVCKISDFGISKRTDDGSGGAHTAMQGTVFWMAPEVINTRKKGYNFKIDIWSVGCVVLEMWAGMRPWMGDEVVAVMFKLYQSKLPPPVPEDVVLSELADDFRRKCFAINPEERPTAAELRKHPYLVLPPDWIFTDF